MKKIFKEEISQITPYEPGKPIEEVERELGVPHAVKLASNENPLGVSPKALKALQKGAKKAFLYPDGGCFYLKKRLAKELGVSPQNLIIGNGSNEIIEFLARGFLGNGEKVISSETSFLVYPIITKVYGGRYAEVKMNNFRFDLSAILSEIDDQTRLIFIANPNNPTGTYLNKKEIEGFLGKVPEHVVVCFDEAYFDFVESKDFPNSIFHVKSGKSNVVVLRTFSKSYGLAGLRIGYGVAHPDVIQYLDKIRQPFNVNRLAQEAACAALDDKVFLSKTKRVIASGRKFLYGELNKLGLRCVPSEANFILFDVKQNASQVFELLLKKGIIVRSMKSYGLQTYIRVSVGTQSENRKFIQALKEVLKS